jgi:hypothetical protein
MSFKQTQTGIRNPEKQVRFAIASACTKGAKAVQAADVRAIEGAFTIRTRWDVVGPYAVKVQAAKKDDNPIVALVGTGADFIEKFIREPEGSTVLKLPQGEFIAIPTTNVRRTKRDLIRAAQRPRALRGKGDFVIPLKNGTLGLFQRQGRKGQKKAVLLYRLVKRARIKERDVLFGPAQKILDAQLLGLYQQGVAQAIATAK